MTDMIDSAGTIATTELDPTVPHPGDERPAALQIGEFAAGLTFEDLPTEVVERAKLFILDCVGIAFASRTFDFAQPSLAALTSLGEGDQPVIGHHQRLALRDAVMMNGILVHGLDYDDTHVAAVTHASASAFPTALGLAAARGRTGRDLLVGYVLGVEVSARVGMAATGGFHPVGYHPTGVAGAYGCATLAARMDGLPAQGIAQAQGVVGSMASGTLEFLESGAWTKRAHPGWAGVCGITAAAFARQGFLAPERTYEGRYGLYATHLSAAPTGSGPDLTLLTGGLGEVWEVLDNAVKPYPACHFVHAHADAVLELVRREHLEPDDVQSVTCLIHPNSVGVVCEPAANKLAPRSDYDAKFSLPFVVAAALVRRRFTLAELLDDALHDPAILDVAARVGYEADLTSGFPRHYSGEVVVRTTDGRELRYREQVNRGADERPLSAAEIEAKYDGNMALALAGATGADGGAVAGRIKEAVLGLDRQDDARAFAELLRG